MGKIKRGYRRIRYSFHYLIRNSRVVESGSFPLYRLMMVGSVISGIILLTIGKIPASIQDASPNDSWKYLTLFFQALGGILALCGLYYDITRIKVISEGLNKIEISSIRLHRSLILERTGVIMTIIVILSYLWGVIWQNHSVPAAQATWFGIIFAWYLIRTRLPEISRAIKELKS